MENREEVAAEVPPSYSSNMFSFEASFEKEFGRRFVDDMKHVSVLCSVIYVVLLYYGRRYMSSREPFVLRRALVIWNVCLTVFSVSGAVRTVPELVHSLYYHGWKHSLCDASIYGHGPGFWVFLFTLSKIVELGDTAFIVLRKQPLQFLHWYHHITVMMYCFYSYPMHVPSGRWFTVMNYCVHSTMYAYYAFKAMKFNVPRPIAVCVTCLQIVQMATGLAVALGVTVIKTSGGECNQSFTNIAVTLSMYISYLVLFLHFFYRAYAAPRPRVVGGSAKKATSVGENGVRGDTAKKAMIVGENGEATNPVKNGTKKFQ